MFEETEVSPSTRGEVPPELSLIRADRPRSIGVGKPGIQPPSLPRTEKVSDGDSHFVHDNPRLETILEEVNPPPAPPIDDVARTKEVVGVKRKAEEDEEWEEFEPRRTKKKHGGGKQKRWKDDLIGRSVRKFFRGYGYFNGVVDRVFKNTGQPRFRFDWSDNTKSTHPLSNFNSMTTEFNQWELENKEQPSTQPTNNNNNVSEKKSSSNPIRSGGSAATSGANTLTMSGSDRKDRGKNNKAESQRNIDYFGQRLAEIMNASSSSVSAPAVYEEGIPSKVSPRQQRQSPMMNFGGNGSNGRMYRQVRL